LPRQQTPWFPLLLCFGSDSARAYKSLATVSSLPRREREREQREPDLRRSCPWPASPIEVRNVVRDDRLGACWLIVAFSDAGKSIGAWIFFIGLFPPPPAATSAAMDLHASASGREPFILFLVTSPFA
jgi:hypothetical protein